MSNRERVMASATFGRKGLSADVAGQPARRHVQFGQAGADRPADPLAERREAFLAAERARAADAGDEGNENPSGAPPAIRAKPVLIRERSLGTAYLLWLFLGGFSAHRFYLGATLSAVAQVGLLYVSLTFFLAGNAGAFYPLALGWLWIIGDVFMIPGLREKANERLRKRAERLAELVSS